MHYGTQNISKSLNSFFGIFLSSLLVIFTSPLQADSGRAETLHKKSPRADGSSIYWSLAHPATADKRGVMLIAQGSGCQPAIGNLAVAEAEEIMPDFSVLLVEKYGVTHRDKPEDAIKDCSETYFHSHTVSQRVADIAQILRQLKGAPWWNGKLVLVGGSEGGAVVARLAPVVKPDAVVAFSSALGLPLAESIERVIPPFAVKEAREKLQEARENPQSDTLWGGNSYRWWADIMDVVLVNDLLKSRVPVLLVQGARDQFAPVASARASQAAYQKAGRCELTYWELPDYDHFMADSAGTNHRKQVFERMSGWVRKTLNSNQPDEC